MKLLLLVAILVIAKSNARRRLEVPKLEEEILQLSAELFRSDVNGLGKEIVLNLQSKTARVNVDKAREPLFKWVPLEKFSTLPTYATMLRLVDNYEAAVSALEHVTGEELAEEDQFLYAIMNTDVMRKAHSFLVHKGKADPNPDKFAKYLKTIWFGLYSRAKGVPGSSGFEHVFLGELKHGVTGMHSWIRYSLEERNGNVNYLGYLDIVPVGDDYLIELPIYWRNVFKEISSIFVGTSPELEMALYTVCFTLMPDKRCPIDRSGPKSVFIQSYRTVYEGQTYIGTAYPTL